MIYLLEQIECYAARAIIKAPKWALLLLVRVTGLARLRAERWRGKPATGSLSDTRPSSPV